MKKSELGLAALFLLLAGTVGWLLTWDAAEPAPNTAAKKQTPTIDPITKSAVTKRRSPNLPAKSSAASLQDLLSKKNERVIRFDSQEDYERFLNSLKDSNVRLLGSIAPLKALRIGYDNLSDLTGLLDEDLLSYNYQLFLPLPPTEGTIQPGAVGFKGNALQWLGIDGDNSTWGAGITIAIIDSGILDHTALPADIQRIDLISNSPDSQTINPHGTAVASLIAGQNNITPGVTPSATLLDVRVADGNGNSDSFTLAQGIIAAVDAGAEVLNISMGSYLDSPILSDAVQYARDAGAVIVASPGNDGLETLAYPAGYSQATAIGAVDAEGNHIDFSNSGDTVDLTAPGLEVYAAWSEDRYIEFTGTSASAPYGSSAIAYAMSEYDLPAQAAEQLVYDLANEAGLPGQDPLYGIGHLDVGRIQNHDTPGIYDLAAVSNIVTYNESDTLYVVVQNQGTESLSNSTVNVTTPTSELTLTTPTLPPGETHTLELAVTIPNSNEDTFIETRVEINPAFQDNERSNNTKITTIPPRDP
ncbi:MAG: S8 family serine peptidase [Verrucomicrobiota bacterium]